jgi:hypothetical protein
VVTTLLVESVVIVTVVAAAVDHVVEVTHFAVSSSVEVTVALSRPRFSITSAPARRASRAARNSARFSAMCLLASRRRLGPPVAVAYVVDEAVSRAAAKATVGMIVHHGSR